MILTTTEDDAEERSCVAMTHLDLILEWVGFIVGFMGLVIVGMVLACVFYPLILSRTNGLLVEKPGPSAHKNLLSKRGLGNISRDAASSPGNSSHFLYEGRTDDCNIHGRGYQATLLEFFCSLGVSLPGGQFPLLLRGVILWTLRRASSVPG